MRKPRPWNVSAGLIRDEWRWVWGRGLYVPFWEAGGDPRDYGPRHDIATRLGTTGWTVSAEGTVLGFSTSGSARLSLPATGGADVSGDKITVFMVVRPAHDSSDNAFTFYLDKTDDNTDGYRFFKSSKNGPGPAKDTFRFRIPELSTPSVDSASHTWSAGERITLAGTYDGSTLAVYFNGQPSASTSSTGTFSSTNDALFVGRDQATGNTDQDDHFQGDFITLLVLPVALNESQIFSLHQSLGFGLFRPMRRVLVAIPAAGGQSVVVGLATEADTAQPVTGAKAGTVGLAQETDTGFAVTAGGAVSVGLATSTASAFTVSIAKLATLGLATTSATAFGMTVIRTLIVNDGEETDTAFAVGRLKTRTVGLSTETNTAFVVTTGNAVPVGLATSTSSAFTMTWAKARTVGLATETDTGFVTTPLRIHDVGLASSVASALAATVQRAFDTGLASEANTALALATPSKVKPVGLASDTETALVVTVGGGVVVSPGTPPFRAEGATGVTSATGTDGVTEAVE